MQASPAEPASLASPYYLYLNCAAKPSGDLRLFCCRDDIAPPRPDVNSEAVCEGRLKLGCAFGHLRAELLRDRADRRK